MGSALDIPIYRTCPGHVEVRRVRCPAMADPGQHWGLRALHRREFIFLDQDHPHVYVDVWQETRSIGNHPRIENSLKTALHRSST